MTIGKKNILLQLYVDEFTYYASDVCVWGWEFMRQPAVKREGCGGCVHGQEWAA